MLIYNRGGSRFVDFLLVGCWFFFFLLITCVTFFPSEEDSSPGMVSLRRVSVGLSQGWVQALGIRPEAPAARHAWDELGCHRLSLLQFYR